LKSIRPFKPWFNATPVKIKIIPMLNYIDDLFSKIVGVSLFMFNYSHFPIPVPIEKVLVDILFYQVLNFSTSHILFNINCLGVFSRNNTNKVSHITSNVFPETPKLLFEYFPHRTCHRNVAHREQ